MSPLILYVVKSIACSGILYAYYLVAYRNRPNHLWSRFFLLSTVLISLLLPFVKIDVPVLSTFNNTGVIELLNVVTTNNIEGDESLSTSQNKFNRGSLLLILYFSISSLLFVLFLRRLVHILNIYSSSPGKMFDGIRIITTSEKNTPFSFFNTVFWSSRINLNSSIGEKILQHEKAHIHQLHSLDRLFMNLIMIFFWCNPFFWLINKELIVVHEFIADKKAVNDNNPETLSEMLLISAFPAQHFGITSAFFNSSIKRRLTMLTKLKNSKAAYLGKWMLLPVMLLLLAGFTLRKKTVYPYPKANFTVVIDAGHGGERSGALAPDGTKEKDLTLSIAMKIKEVNKNDNIKIVMTRETDEDLGPRQRVESAIKSNTGAFLSIHLTNDQSGKSGIQLMMTKKSTVYAAQSQLLGSLLTQEIKKVYKVDDELKKGPADRGVWVLDAPEIRYPSLLIDCGNLQSSEDVEFMKSPANQEKIAQHILRAIYQFAEFNR